MTMPDHLTVLVPTFLPGSGGHKTILENLLQVRERGVAVTFRLEALDGAHIDLSAQRDLALQLCPAWAGDIELAVGWDDVRSDAVLATVAQSAWPAHRSRATTKFYFVQDRESWFNPVSATSLEIEMSYSLPLQKITIGSWLRHMLAREFGQASCSIPFGVDVDTYHPCDLRSSDWPQIALITQPEKPRRLTELLRSVCEVLITKRSDVRIVTYGSSQQLNWGLPHDHVGLISNDDCARLYGSSSVGVCLSASNPSRIPFEMAAVGLPVVDIFGYSTMFDYREADVLLAVPKSEAIAEAILHSLSIGRHKALQETAGRHVVSRLEEAEAFANAMDHWEERCAEPLPISTIRSPFGRERTSELASWVSHIQAQAEIYQEVTS